MVATTNITATTTNETAATIKAQYGKVSTYNVTNDTDFNTFQECANHANETPIFGEAIQTAEVVVETVTPQITAVVSEEKGEDDTPLTLRQMLNNMNQDQQYTHAFQNVPMFASWKNETKGITAVDATCELYVYGFSIREIATLRVMVSGCQFNASRVSQDLEKRGLVSINHETNTVSRVSSPRSKFAEVAPKMPDASEFGISLAKLFHALDFAGVAELQAQFQDNMLAYNANFAAWNERKNEFERLAKLGSETSAINGLKKAYLASLRAADAYEIACQKLVSMGKTGEEIEAICADACKVETPQSGEGEGTPSDNDAF